MAKKPLDEEQVTLTQVEIEKLESWEKADAGPSTPDKPVIQEVTDILRLCYNAEECKRYFKPTFVAIGPLNHQEKTKRDLRFESGEKWKQQMAKMFVNFCGKAGDFYKNVKKEMKSLRKYYIEEVKKLSDEELAWIFLVDGCALLHFIALDVTDQWEEFRVLNDLVGIEKCDFFLLENQLPYRLLEILIESIDEAAIAESGDVKPKELFKKFINDFIDKSFLSLIAQEQPQNQLVHSRPHSPKESFKKFIRRLCLTAQELPQNQVDHSQPHSHKEEQHEIQVDQLSLSAQEQPQNQVDHSQPHSHNEEQHEIQVDQFSLIAQEQPQNQFDHSQPRSHNEEQHEIQVDQSQPHSYPVQPQENPAHLLDMLRRRLMGVKSTEKKLITKDDWWRTLVNRDKSKHWLSINNAKELKDKGIRFKVRKKADAITGIDFNDHCCMPTLTLSPIFLHNTTVPLLLNLMAYELCPDFKENCEIVSHMSILDSLIDNGEDVKELRDANVLHHGLGSDEAVAKLFNNISGILVPNLVRDPQLNCRIYAYCKSKRSWVGGLRASIGASLIHICCRRPWTFLAFFAALAGLIMTGIQTHYSLPGNKSP